MSDSDKTRDKLVSSIRKTKAGVAQREGAYSTPPKNETPADNPSAAPRTPPKTAAPAEKRSSQRSRPASDRTVPYLRSTRVWPD